MEQDNLDRKIKEILENFEVDYNPLDWEAMEERIEMEEMADAPPLEDFYVDAVAYSNLENLKVPFEQAHWDKMSARLDQEFAVPRYVIIRYKLVEVALMLLFIFTIIQFLPNKKQQNIAEGPVTDFESALVPGNGTHQLVPATELDPAPTKNTKPLTSSSEDKTKNNTESYAADLDDRSPSAVRSARTTRRSGEISRLPDNLLPFLLAPDPTDDLPALEFSEPLIAQFPRTLIEGLQQLNVSSIYLSGNFDDGTKRLSLITSDRQLIRLRVGMFGTGDYNIIFTPYDEIFSWDAYTHGALGYGGGLSLSFDFGQVEIETGLIYAAKSYLPRSPIEKYGNLDNGIVTESFDVFDLDILQIPFNVQFTLNHSNKWRLYTLTGASLNTVIQANYKSEVEIDYSSSNLGFAAFGGAAGGRPVRDLRNSNSEIFKAKELPNGWFEGGSFSRNSFLSLNVGAGLERAFNPRWSLFVEPSFNYHIFSFDQVKNIGPNNDRINGLMLKTGAKVNLK